MIGDDNRWHACTPTRRRFLGSCAASIAAYAAGRLCAEPPDSSRIAAPREGALDARTADLARQRLAADRDKALIAITLDLEMSRNFPTWETTHWDYEKGNLNGETKQYALQACRRVKARGGVIHNFVVGRTLEQENVDWLTEIAAAGHPIGNHTYDHINVLATELAGLQHRFTRAPWLIAGRTPRDVIVENVRLTSAALKERIGVDAAGFRTPGGFGQGFVDRPDMQQLFRELGFWWISSKSSGISAGKADEPPTAEVFESVVAAQPSGQPFVYPNGLVEAPFSPISDIQAFRSLRWKLDDFLRAVRLGVEWTIENRATFDLLSHPSCMYVMDPRFQTYDMICDLVDASRGKAHIVDLGTIATRALVRQAANQGR